MRAPRSGRRFDCRHGSAVRFWVMKAFSLVAGPSPHFRIWSALPQTTHCCAYAPADLRRDDGLVVAAPAAAVVVAAAVAAVVVAAAAAAVVAEIVVAVVDDGCCVQQALV